MKTILRRTLAAVATLAALLATPLAMATPTKATLRRGEIMENAPAAPPPRAIIKSIKFGAVRA